MEKETDKIDAALSEIIDAPNKDIEDVEGIEKIDAADLYEHHNIVVDPKQTPLRLDKYLLNKIEKISRNKIQNAIKAGAVLVNDKVVKANHKVTGREVISIVLPTPPPIGHDLLAEKIDLDIRHEDEHIMIVYKPPGMVVHPGVGNYTGTLVNGLKYYFENKELPVMPSNEQDRPGLVHRIDKDTSGLLVIAKTELAMTHLSKQFFDHSIEREYYAIVWGNFEEQKGKIEINIGRHPKERLKQHCFPDGDEGKHAVTHYEVVKDYYYISLVKLHLETGRTHQIRVHMSYLGHPVFNDARYNGNAVRKGTIYSKYKQFVENSFKLIPRQALHAKSLGFIHPATGKKVFFDSELPEDFNNTLAKWEHYLESRKPHEM